MFNVLRQKLRQKSEKRKLDSAEEMVCQHMSTVKSEDAADLINSFISRSLQDRSPEECLKILFQLDRLIYIQESKKAILYEGGEHPKHRLVKYHEFFCKNILNGKKVLEVGSGKGYLSFEIARALPGSDVTGIEISRDRVEKSSAKYKLPNLRYICADATRDHEGVQYDIVVMSNLLEHIQDRGSFLLRIQECFKPERILIRVPQYNRDWRMPLKDELGINSLYPGHYTEYTEQSFLEELSSAGIRCLSATYCWGEIWAVTAPEKSQ